MITLNGSLCMTVGWETNHVANRDELRAHRARQKARQNIYSVTQSCQTNVRDERSNVRRVPTRYNRPSYKRLSPWVCTKHRTHTQLTK